MTDSSRTADASEPDEVDDVALVPADRDPSVETSGVEASTSSATPDADDDRADPADRSPATPGRHRGRHGRHSPVDANDRDGDDAVFPGSTGALVAQTAGLAAAAWVLVAWLYRVWDATMLRPLAILGGDQYQLEAMIKTIRETGWYLHQPRLGAPWGQQYQDVPHGGETLQLFAIKLITLFVKPAGLTMNLYYLFGFGWLAAVTFLVLRHLRFGPVISAACAFGYTFLPNHFVRGEGHLYRSNYFSVPLAALLLIWVASWRTRFLVDPTSPPGVRWRDNIRWWRVVAAIALCAVVGTTETMATFFTLVLLGAATALNAIRWREWQRLVVGLVAIAAIGGSFFVASSPSFLFWHRYGTNEVAGRRSVAESELYGLKISRLVTPSSGSRIKALDRLGLRSQERSVVPSEGGQALGILGTAGLVGLLYAAIAGVRRRSQRGGDLRQPHDRENLRDQSALFAMLVILFGTIGGFSVVVSLLGFSQIRTWGRISMFIAFFATVQIALWAEQLARWARGRSPGIARPALGVLAFVLVAGTVATGPPVRRMTPARVDDIWNGDRAYLRRIERKMPEGSAVFMLPVMPFPENGSLESIHDYDPLRAYLSDNGKLRWSYGAVKGRWDADWQLELRDRVGPVGGMPGLLGMGFTGLWVDTYGYVTDDGKVQLQQIDDLLGTTPMISPDKRFRYYDLRPYKARLGQTDQQLRATARRLFKVVPPPAPRPDPARKPTELED